MKVYIDEATASLDADIRVIYDKVDGSGLIADLGGQINGLDDRLTIVEGKVGALENKFDANGNLVGNIIGDVTGNTEGNHTGDVLDADGNVIVDVANANFNGNVLGNLTGNTVGNHYGSVYNDATDVLLIDGATGNFIGTDLALSGNAGIAGTLQVTSAAAFANTVEVEELLHAKKDLIADGAGAVGGGLQVGEQVLARSARLNDNPAGPDDATEIPFLAVEGADVVTKAYLEGNTYSQTQVDGLVSTLETDFDGIETNFNLLGLDTAEGSVGIARTVKITTNYPTANTDAGTAGELRVNTTTGQLYICITGSETDGSGFWVGFTPDPNAF